jgi:hypothetical protein
MIKIILQIEILLLTISLIGCGEDNTEKLTPNEDPKELVTTTPSRVVVTTSHSIQDAINKLSKSGGTLFLKAGIYKINSGIHINRSNVSIIGEQGVIIKLKNGVNQPVILIGTDIATPTNANLIENISISNLEINGNQLAQTSEIDPARPHIRNNGIDIRRVNNLWIDNVDIHNARSGGIVASWKSSNIFISKIKTHDNYFDGIALYDSTNIIVSNFISNNNDHGAGISLDNKLKNITFSNGIIQGNSDVGIFVRDSNNILFSSIVIDNNGNHGVFMSHNDNDPATTGVNNILFTGCSFTNNAGSGLQLKSLSSNKNAVTGSLFNNNKDGCIIYDKSSLSEGANICYN